MSPRSPPRAASRCTSTPASAASLSPSGPSAARLGPPVPGVTSLSADLHKYGYAPKGVSVLLTRGRDRQRHQYFATTAWPGYPVVNPTLTGSKPAGPLAAAWAITEALGAEGFARLTEQAARATACPLELVDGIEGLRVVGAPIGPLFAVATDDDACARPSGRPAPLGGCRARGRLAPAAAARAHAGRRLPAAAHAHLTVTPVTAGGAARALGGARRRGRRGPRRAPGRR